jgi:hypothetical protein
MEYQSNSGFCGECAYKFCTLGGDINMTKHSEIPIRYSADERKIMAGYIRSIRILLRLTPKDRFKWLRMVFYCVIIISIGVCLKGCESPAWSQTPPIGRYDGINRIGMLERRDFGPATNIEGYSINQWANAIYMAEGGIHAEYQYGIRSINYSSTIEARRMCENTVRHNEKRFRQYGYKRYSRFIEFLASKYCPTIGRHLTKSERRLNKFWINNVQYYLTKGN